DDAGSIELGRFWTKRHDIGWVYIHGRPGNAVHQLDNHWNTCLSIWRGACRGSTSLLTSISLSTNVPNKSPKQSEGQIKHIAKVVVLVIRLLPLDMAVAQWTNCPARGRQPPNCPARPRKLSLRVSLTSPMQAALRECGAL